MGQAKVSGCSNTKKKLVVKILLFFVFQSTKQYEGVWRNDVIKLHKLVGERDILQS